MNDKCMPTCECQNREDLVRRVLDHDLRQSQDNLVRDGSYWGNRANAALMALARKLLVDHVLDRGVPYEEAEARVNEYLQVDLRVYTLEATCTRHSQMAEVWRMMQEQTKSYAVPVLKAVKEHDLQGVDALVEMLTDAVRRMALPNVDSGDFQAVPAEGVEVPA